MSCAFACSLGVFVLDALDPAEREAVARHVERCPRCRRELEEMSPLPALLASVPLADAEALAPAPRRGVRGGLAALCVALLLFLAVGVDLARDTLRAPAQTAISARDRATGVRMAGEVAGVPAGARVVLRLDGVPAGERCRLVARAADGRSEVVARWRASYAGAATVAATTSIAAHELSELSVIAEGGRRLLRIPVRGAVH